jgi:hypothetical protein
MFNLTNTPKFNVGGPVQAGAPLAVTMLPDRTGFGRYTAHSPHATVRPAAACSSGCVTSSSSSPLIDERGAAFCRATRQFRLQPCRVSAIPRRRVATPGPAQVAAGQRCRLIRPSWSAAALGIRMALTCNVLQPAAPELQRRRVRLVTCDVLRARATCSCYVPVLLLSATSTWHVE